MTRPTGYVQQTNDEYHADTEVVSKSHLDVIASGSPLHYWDKYLAPDREPEEPTEAMIDGSAIHAAILEPDVFTSAYVVAPEEAPPRPTQRQRNAAKPSQSTLAAIAFWDDFDAEHAGKIVLRAKSYATALAIRDAVHRHPVAAGLLADCATEASYYARDTETGEYIKCRVDALKRNGSAIIDVKSCESASEAAFRRACERYRYPVQTAWYNRVFDSEFGEHPPLWVFLAVEKVRPYATGVYYISAGMPELERAEIAAQRDFQRIIDCKRSGIWPDYGHEPRPLEMSQWAKL